MKQHLIVVFICIFLMTDDTEHLFLFMLAICLSSLEIYLFIPFAHFVMELFVIVYSLARKCSKSCRSPDLNGVGFRHAEAQRKVSV